MLGLTGRGGEISVTAAAALALLIRDGRYGGLSETFYYLLFKFSIFDAHLRILSFYYCYFF